MSEPKPTYLTRSASAPPPKENDMDFKIAPRTETTFKASAEAVTISQRGPQGGDKGIVVIPLDALPDLIAWLQSVATGPKSAKQGTD